MTTYQEVAVTSCSQDPRVSAYVWDVDTGTTLMTYRGDLQVSSNSLSLLQDQYVVAALQDKPFLRVWPVNSQQPINSLRLVCPGKVNLAQVSPDGCYIAVTVDKKLHVYQIASGCLVGSGERHFRPIRVVRWKKDGNEVACGGEDGFVTVWSLSQLTSSETTPEPRLVFSDHSLSVTDLKIGFGSRPRLFSVSLDRTCKVYDLMSGNLLLNVVYDLPLTAVAVLSLESEVFVAASSGDLYQLFLLSPPRQIEYHVTSSQNSPVFKGHTQPVYCLSVSNSGQLLMSGSMDGEVKIWNIGSRMCLRTIAHKGPVTNAFFTCKPKQMFVDELKPSVVLSCFQSPNNTSTNLIEVITRQKLTLHDDSDELFPIETTDLSDAKTKSLQMDVDLLRSINSSLYKFTIDKLIEKDSHRTLPANVETMENFAKKKKNQTPVNSYNFVPETPVKNVESKKKKNRKRKKGANKTFPNL